MKNFVQPANIVDLTAPAGGIASGEAHMFGSLFGVATTSAAEGAKVAVSLEGVFKLPKATGAGIVEGSKAYWNGDEITGVEGDDPAVGHIVASASADALTVFVRIKN
ncbi:DUF2190 family protein [Brucella pituitosa]|uniref:DUF2190 family protein n=1 Tax=Brucella pituitosa TaxID=571256 RepID=UPI000CFF0C25|nr:hypothetical protein CQ062_01815 [Ochrobactrum sp. MYb68]